MQVKEASGMDFANIFLSIMKLANDEDGPDSRGHIDTTYRAHGNIVGLLMSQYDETYNVFQVVYVIEMPEERGVFRVFLAKHGDVSHDTELDGNRCTSFTFMDGTKIVEYSLRELTVAASDIWQFFETERIPEKREFHSIHDSKQYYTV